MQKFETCDEVEAQRCKRAQYLGRVSTIALSGSYVTGLVYSVVEDGASLPEEMDCQDLAAEQSGVRAHQGVTPN